MLNPVKVLKVAKKTIPAEALEYFKEQGSRGGKIGTQRRMENLTPEQRSAVAKTAAAARWKDKPPKVTKPRDKPLTPEQSKKLAAKAAKDPSWKNKTTGAKKI